MLPRRSEAKVAADTSMMLSGIRLRTLPGHFNHSFLLLQVRR
jgi:hypothetical protein